MASTTPSKRTALLTLVEQRRPERIGEALFADLMQALAPVSESYLRRLLRECGVPLAPLVEGVRQDSFEALERSLTAFELEYREAYESGDGRRARVFREAVITAKDHARFSLRSAKLTQEQRAAKEEMVLWMLTWLENPGVFPEWLALRKRAMTPLPDGRGSDGPTV